MAELALAIVPLCLGAIKGINIVNKKLKILRHHDKEIKRLRKKFTTQTEIFLDEFQLLLQDLLDPMEAEALIEDTSHPTWNSPELNEQIRTFLGRKYGLFNEAVHEFEKCVASLDQGLETHPSQSSNNKVRQAVDIMLNKAKYESSIEGLKESNQEIKRLRKTAGKIQRCQAQACTKRSRPLPPVYQEIMQHSKSFYDALRSFWSCFQAHHTDHDVRLLLDSRNDASLRIIVRYHTKSGVQVEDGLIDLLIRSQDLRLRFVSLPTAEASTSRGGFNESRPRKIRKVTFLEDRADSTTVTTLESSVLSASMSCPPALIDLCSAGDLCSHLCRQSNPTSCRGYIDTPDQLRHHVYPTCDAQCNHKLCLGKKSLKHSPLNAVFRSPVDRSISVPEQLRLALRLVKGVLQFHSTPWLQPYWRLQDLSYFHTDEGLAASLDTLHISSELSKRQEQQLDAIMIEHTQDPATAQLKYGIRNLTMHSLGVALLQIGQWGAINPGNVVEVRKLADLVEYDSRLGPRYQKITQKCLDCDFGFGKDLSQPELQDAIYKDVVCELENLIGVLEGKVNVDQSMKLCHTK